MPHWNTYSNLLNSIQKFVIYCCAFLCCFSGADRAALVMKFNLFKQQTTPMVAAKPTGASDLTVTPAPVALVSAENSTEPVNKNDAFDEIKNKFLNEIDKIPRECLAKAKTVIDVALNNYFGIRFSLLLQASSVP